MLATIAALADEPLANVRAFALQTVRLRKWARFVRNARVRRMPWQSAVDIIARQFGGAGLAATMMATPDSLIVGQYDKTLPARGRGTVRLTVKGRRLAHIVPWCDGFMYDPMDPDPMVGMTLAEYLAANPRLSVDVIRKWPIAGNPEDNPEPATHLW
jgi:hypothetical protein